MLYSTAVAYDVDRVSPDNVDAHVRAVAARLFPHADGFDHQTLHLHLPGRERQLPNGQTIRLVTVDCHGPAPT